jgi:hypothetical protein
MKPVALGVHHYTSKEEISNKWPKTEEEFSVDYNKLEAGELVLNSNVNVYRCPNCGAEVVIKNE